jgi:Skp family chaperone for outer membrane proteins
MEKEMNEVNFKWVKRHSPREKAMGKGILEFKKHKEKESWKMRTKYKNKTTKFYP